MAFRRARGSWPARPRGFCITSWFKEPQHCPALARADRRLELRRAYSPGAERLGLHDELRGDAKEVDDIGADGDLSTELKNRTIDGRA